MNSTLTPSDWGKARKWMLMVVPPFILLLGIAGNVAAILVLRRMSRKGSTFSLFFMALAVSDLLVLCVTLLSKWVGYTFGFKLRDQSEATCRLLRWLGYSVGMLSAWLLASLTVHRAVSGAMPHRVRVRCSRKHALVTVGVLAGVAFAVNVYTLFTLAVRGEEGCSFSAHFQKNVQPTLGWLEMLLYSLLPALVIVCSNCLLLHRLTRSGRRVSWQTKTHLADRRILSRVTLTLIVVSVAFLVLTLPLGVLQVPGQSDPELFKNDAFRFWYSLTGMLWYTNSAVNFYLYLLTGSKFRRELRIMFSGGDVTSDGADF